MIPLTVLHRILLSQLVVVAERLSPFLLPLYLL